MIECGQRYAPPVVRYDSFRCSSNSVQTSNKLAECSSSVVALAFSMHSAIIANGFISGIAGVSSQSFWACISRYPGALVPTGSGELLVHGRDGKFRSRDTDLHP